MSRSVTAYPWGSLERLTRRALNGAREARRSMQQSVRLDGLGLALAELLAADVELVLRDIRTQELPRGSDDVSLMLPDGTRVLLRPDRELATRAVFRLLGRTGSVGAPDAPLGEPVLGALAAIVVEAARRSGAREPLVLASPPNAGEPAVRIDATALVDGRPYAVSVWVAANPCSRRSEPRLERAGDLRVAVPLVVALSLAERHELHDLNEGDAWMPGEGWWITASGVGRGVLAAAAGERGVAVDLAEDGAIVLRHEAVPLGADEEEAMQSQNDDGRTQLTSAVLDSPVVVRVELGAVSMTAREWASLEPGDVIETGHRINHPVVLRVAGHEVARGELVEVEGELGVRVREIHAQKAQP